MELAKFPEGEITFFQPLVRSLISLEAILMW